jgi:hypothetical protein
MRILFLFFSLITLSATAKKPTELFGIEVGSTHEFEIIMDEGSNSILSVKTSVPLEKIVGVRNNWYV